MKKISKMFYIGPILAALSFALFAYLQFSEGDTYSGLMMVISIMWVGLYVIQEVFYMKKLYSYEKLIDEHIIQAFSQIDDLK